MGAFLLRFRPQRRAEAMVEYNGSLIVGGWFLAEA
jgi:hypothetical protein